MKIVSFFARRNSPCFGRNLAYQNPIIILVYLYFDKVKIGRRDFFFFQTSCTSYRTHASVLTFFFFQTSCTSYRTHASVLTFFFCCIVLFHSCCSQARVFGKTLVHEFIVSYSQAELYLHFFDSATISAQIESVRAGDYYYSQRTIVTTIDMLKYLSCLMIIIAWEISYILIRCCLCKLQYDCNIILLYAKIKYLNNIIM